MLIGARCQAIAKVNDISGFQIKELKPFCQFLSSSTTTVLSIRDKKESDRHQEFGLVRFQHFVAGQAVKETVNSVYRGITGAEPTVLIVFYPGTPGLPLSQ